LIGLFGLSFFAYALPVVQAGLVPCGAGTDDPTTRPIDESLPCRPCDLFILGQNIFSFLVLQVALPLTVFAIIVSGVVMLFAGGILGASPNAGLKSKAKGMLQTALIGFLIILLAWAIVNTVIVWLAGSTQPSGFPWPWYEPQCAARPSCYVSCFDECFAGGVDRNLCQWACQLRCNLQ